MKTIFEALKQAEEQHKIVLLTITKNYGITIAEWKLLNLLRNHINTQDKLSIETGLDHSTLSRQLHSLQKKELVMSAAIGHKNRQLHYELTVAGDDTLEEANVKYASFQDRVFQLWSDEELNMLQILLNRLHKSMKKPL
jgi:DNA-binding MarR family transcriptional regulator